MTTSSSWALYRQREREDCRNIEEDTLDFEWVPTSYSVREAPAAAQYENTHLRKFCIVEPFTAATWVAANNKSLAEKAMLKTEDNLSVIDCFINKLWGSKASASKQKMSEHF